MNLLRIVKQCSGIFFFEILFFLFVILEHRNKYQVLFLCYQKVTIHMCDVVLQWLLGLHAPVLGQKYVFILLLFLSGWVCVGMGGNNE